MTIYGHNMVMKSDHEDSVRIADFKARMGRHLSKVRRGHPLTLLDRNTPIAEIVPYSPGGRLKIRKPTRRLADVRLLPPLKQPIDSLTMLAEERRDRR